MATASLESPAANSELADSHQEADCRDEQREGTRRDGGEEDRGRQRWEGKARKEGKRRVGGPDIMWAAWALAYVTDDEILAASFFDLLPRNLRLLRCTVGDGEGVWELSESDETEAACACPAAACSGMCDVEYDGASIVTTLLMMGDEQSASSGARWGIARRRAMLSCMRRTATEHKVPTRAEANRCSRSWRSN